MKMMLPLYPFQRKALDDLRSKFQAERDSYRLAIVLPTGGGKTVTFSHLTAEHLRDNPGQRVVVLVHTDELVEQAYESMVTNAPHLKVGIVKSARNDVFADVIIASVQTLKNPKRLSQITCVGLVIVDECHHAPAASYVTVMEAFGCFSGKCKAVGFTATFMRGDGKPLIPTWQGVAFQRDVSWMVRKRYLIPPKGKAVSVPNLDLRNVKSTKSDFREKELGAALAESLAPEIIAKAYAEHASDRRGILFAPTVASAEVFAEEFRNQGITCEVVHGAMEMGDKRNPEPGTRRRVLRNHKAGITQVIANCMVLTEGYNDPEVSCIVVARPTKSTGLYIQMVGRGLRVNPDPTVPYESQDCLILDVVGASAMHSLRSIADLSERQLTEEEAHSGKTLIELEDEFDAGPGVEADEPVFWTGDVEVRDFDPLGNKSSKVWIKSTEGTFFVPAGKDAFVFIMQYPEPGAWSVAWCSKTAAGKLFACGAGEEGVPRLRCTCGQRCAGRPVGMTKHAGLPLDVAMVWAEDLAVDMGADTMNLANKKAAWRRKPPSPGTLSMARGLGITVKGERDPESGLFIPSEKAGEVSDRITKIVGSRRIDPLVKLVRERMPK